MLIQRRPVASMISTRGVSGSGGNGTTAPLARAALRRRGLGSEGIGTERVVGQRHKGSPRKTVYLLLFFRDIAGHIQRGGGTGPMKPRQPPSQSRTGRCQFLRDVWRVSPRPHGGRHDTKGTPTWLLLSSPVANAAPATRSKRATSAIAASARSRFATSTGI